jgi:UDP-N-acetylmuramate dehydrogenase
MNQDVKDKLSSLVSHPVTWQCRLDRYTSFSIGGPAEALVRVDLRSELQPLLIFLTEEKISWRIIGRGTNLLVRDEGFPGVILLLGTEFQAVSKGVVEGSGSVVVRAGGGCSLGKLSRSCIEWGLTGLEFSCGIPGTVGGAVIMNAGAWGGEMSSVIDSITLMGGAGEQRLLRGELDFSYRCWKGFEKYQGKYIVAETALRLEQGDPVKIKKQCRLLLDKRKATQPGQYANGGSFFKNPPGDSAGRLIEASGFKGKIIGGAMVSERHGNFLVNTGSATAEDVLALMKTVQKKVELDSGIELEPEIHFI